MGSGGPNRLRRNYYCTVNTGPSVSSCCVCFNCLVTGNHFVFCWDRARNCWDLLPGRSRWTSIGLGVLILILAGIAISYPSEAALLIIILIAIALLIIGATRIIEGLSRRHRGFSRGFHLGVGILAVVIGIAILVLPSFGATLAGFIIAIGLLVIGIQMVITGIRSHKLPT